MKILTWSKKDGQILVSDPDLRPLFQNDYERNLGLKILSFYDKLDVISKNYEIHVLCEWLYELCVVFTEFYSNCRVVDEFGVVDQNRVFLCEATQVSLRSGFELVGIRAVDVM